MSCQLRSVIHEVRLLYPQGEPLPEGASKAVGYLFHNRRRLDYTAYCHAGYPVGNGATESACKTVVQSRRKQAGMRWSRAGAPAMIALRCLLLSDRWHERPVPP